MAAIQWNEQAMGTGVGSVDGQHKELIAMLNQLLDAMMKGKGKEELGGMIQFLGAYAEKHFSHEEQVMAEHRCPVALVNKQAHARFLQDFKLLAAKFSREGASSAVVVDVQQKMLNWLASHIRGCDANLRKCVTPKAA